MAITPRGTLLTGTASGGPASVNVTADSEATDLQVAFCGSNFFTLDSATDLQPSGGGRTLRFTVDRGADDAKVRVWTRTAAAGAHTISVQDLGGEEVWLAVRRLIGTDLADPVQDIDGATANNRNHTVPALTLAAEGWLLGAAMCTTFSGGSDYTPPAGLTELADLDDPVSASSFAIAEDQAAGPGTIGPFTFQYGTNAAGLAVGIAIREAGAAGVTGTLAVTEAADTLTGSGTAAPPSITGSLAVAEAADALSAAGMSIPPAITGSLSETEAADTLAASGTFTPAGTAGTITVTEQADTLAAAGSHTPPPIAGTLAATELADTLAAAGSFTPEGISGSLAQAEAADTLAASGIAVPPGFTGSIAVTEQVDTLAAAGTVVIEGIAGHVAATESRDTLAAAGTFLLVTRPGTTTAVASLVPTSTAVVPLVSISAVVAGLRPTVNAVPPRVPTSGGVT